jgi:hypothetical protein
LPDGEQKRPPNWQAALACMLRHHSCALSGRLMLAPLDEGFRYLWETTWIVGMFPQICSIKILWAMQTIREKLMIAK